MRNIGIIGGGVVGGGIVNILRNTALKDSITISKICVKNMEKKRDWELPKETILINNPYEIINDPEIDLVVEVMGGTQLAKDIVFDSIKKGKDVVTANKALISLYLKEIEELVQHYKVAFGYEAAVCGGIPIIHSLQKDFIADEITQISGIINGTTNYILSKMEHNPQISFSQVLQEAQDLGYAEANPSADVDGYDVRSKISILTRLAMGKLVDENSISPMGITKIEQIDFQYANLLNCTIKMIGTAKLIDNKVDVIVSPMLIPKSHLFSNITGAKNIIEINSTNLNSTILMGEGAGRLPTANSVVSDIISIILGNDNKPFSSIKNIELNTNYNRHFYIRLLVNDKIGIIKTIGDLFEKHLISIDSIQQIPITNINRVPFVITTNNTTIEQIENVCDEIKDLDFVLEEPLSIPIF